MGRKKRLVIPVFIPFGGCHHQCVFCDQQGITGKIALPSLDEVTDTVESYLSTWKGGGEKEIAFYGGSFTALPDDIQAQYLEAAYAFVKSGQVGSIRVSTRPDCVSAAVVERLKRYGVATVELGAQSMSDEVLRASGRGHTAEDTANAVRLIKDNGMKAGVQFMPGLPGDDRESALRTAAEIISLRPDFIRVYPTLVLKNTPLFDLYASKRYAPWTLEEMVELCSAVYALLLEAGVPVVRMGLQPTADLERNLVAGPYHPSFRQLVEQRLAAG